MVLSSSASVLPAAQAVRSLQHPDMGVACMNGGCLALNCPTLVCLGGLDYSCVVCSTNAVLCHCQVHAGGQHPARLPLCQ
jgi:hypothetical protein